MPPGGHVPLDTTEGRSAAGSDVENASSRVARRPVRVRVVTQWGNVPMSGKFSTACWRGNPASGWPHGTGKVSLMVGSFDAAGVAAAASGHQVVGVRIDGRRHLFAVAPILRIRGAHFINVYGPWTIEGVAAWRSTRPRGPSHGIVRRLVETQLRHTEFARPASSQRRTRVSGYRHPEHFRPGGGGCNL